MFKIVTTVVLKNRSTTAMPHSARSLQSIYQYFISVNESEGVHKEILGKSQEVHTFHHEMLMGSGPFDVDQLKVEPAREFALMVAGLGLNLVDDIDKTSESTDDGYNVLHYVISINRLDLFNILLDHGASPLVADAQGNNAISMAANLGRREMLQEFCKMIEGGDKQASFRLHAESPLVSSHRQAVNDNQENKVESARPSGAFKKDNKTHRVVLSTEDLKRANVDSETGSVVLEKMIQPKKYHVVRRHSADQPLRMGVAKAFKGLVGNVEDEGIVKKDDSVIREEPEAAKEAYKRYLCSNYMYDRLFRQFDGAFVEKRNDVVLKDEKDIKIHPELKAFSDQPKEDAMSVVLPCDRSVVAGVLALLNDYSHFSLLHCGRRHRQDAAALVAPYLQDDKAFKKIGEVEDVLALYRSIKAESEKVESSVHHGEIKNTDWNSSYCRRLSFCLTQLKSTIIIRNYIDGDHKFNGVGYAEFLKRTNHKLKIQA
jgi:hypothetical protein